MARAATHKPAEAAKTAEQVVGECYSRFERAVQEQADTEIAALRSNRELTQKLTDAFDAYLGSRTATQPLLDAFMSSQGNDVVYDFAEQQGFSFFTHMETSASVTAAAGSAYPAPRLKAWIPSFLISGRNAQA